MLRRHSDVHSASVSRMSPYSLVGGGWKLGSIRTSNLVVTRVAMYCQKCQECTAIDGSLRRKVLRCVLALDYICWSRSQHTVESSSGRDAIPRFVRRRRRISKPVIGKKKIPFERSAPSEKALIRWKALEHIWKVSVTVPNELWVLLLLEC
jgi:hypothetical protein